MTELNFSQSERRSYAGPLLGALAVLIVLAVIAWIRHRYMETPLFSAAFQVIVGGVLVFLVGILIGSS